MGTVHHSNEAHPALALWRCLALLPVLICCQVYAADQPPAAAIASAQPMATEAGFRILNEGGNAFDAAVAVTAALGVVEPASSGMGGGGFWLIYRAGDDTYSMVDGREKAPALAHRRMYLDDKGEVIRGASIYGPLAAGIPGIPAGLVYLANNYGRLPLAQSLAPAISYAEQGFKVTPRYRGMMGFRRDALQASPAAAAIFLENNAVPQEGYRIVQRDLAGALRLIADRGHNGFYQGMLAQRMVTGVRNHGGIWSLEDLAAYQVVERQPIVSEYRGVRIVSAAPPSSGVVISEALNILENFDLKAMESAHRKHHIIEAMRRVYRDRAVYLGDPDFVDIPVNRLLDTVYAEALALTINPVTATPSAELSDTPGLLQTGMTTTHFSIIDGDGNRVAATLSINLPFGSGFVPEGTGILLNNEMDDFSIKRMTPNAYGLTGNDANSIQPGKRPLSSMSPVFLETQDRVAILGTPGGSRIISMILLAILDFSAGNGPESWVSLPRYHHQYLPDVVSFERPAFTHEEQIKLIGYGHKLSGSSRPWGNMQAILWDKKQGKVSAASDPRGEGEAMVVYK